MTAVITDVVKPARYLDTYFEMLKDLYGTQVLSGVNEV
jgi:hypothetical protein